MLSYSEKQQLINNKVPSGIGTLQMANNVFFDAIYAI